MTVEIATPLSSLVTLMVRDDAGITKVFLSLTYRMLILDCARKGLVVVKNAVK
jgi:hypothetical protein